MHRCITVKMFSNDAAVQNHGSINTIERADAESSVVLWSRGSMFRQIRLSRNGEAMPFVEQKLRNYITIDGRNGMPLSENSKAV